jgi:hypothetical protein
MYSYEIVTEYHDKENIKQQSETIVAENDNDVFNYATHMLKSNGASLVAIVRRHPIVKIIREYVKNENVKVE